MIWQTLFFPSSLSYDVHVAILICNRKSRSTRLSKHGLLMAVIWLTHIFSKHERLLLQRTESLFNCKKTLILFLAQSGVCRWVRNIYLLWKGSCNIHPRQRAFWEHKCREMHGKLLLMHQIAGYSSQHKALISKKQRSWFSMISTEPAVNLCVDSVSFTQKIHSTMFQSRIVSEMPNTFQSIDSIDNKENLKSWLPQESFCRTSSRNTAVELNRMLLW